MHDLCHRPRPETGRLAGIRQLMFHILRAALQPALDELGADKAWKTVMNTDAMIFLLWFIYMPLFILAVFFGCIYSEKLSPYFKACHLSNRL